MSLNKPLPAQLKIIALVGIPLLLPLLVYGYYSLTNYSQPVSVETKSEFAPATIKLGKEEFIIEGLVLTDGKLLSHRGMPNETVAVTFQSAKLDELTLKGLKRDPPATLTKIEYRANESRKAALGAEPCQTNIDLLATSPMPSELHIFQSYEAGENEDRHFDIRAKGAELLAQIATAPPRNSMLGPGCSYLLSMDPNWNAPMSEQLPLKTRVADNSRISFYFKPLKPAANPWADMNGFLPVDLAQKPEPTNPRPFQARGFKVRGLDASTDRLSAYAPDGAPLLTISDLRIGSDQIQLTIVGKAWVAVDGEPVKVDRLKTWRENPILWTIVGVLIGSLLPWWFAQFKSSLVPALTEPVHKGDRRGEPPNGLD